MLHRRQFFERAAVGAALFGLPLRLAERAYRESAGWLLQRTRRSGPASLLLLWAATARGR